MPLIFPLCTAHKCVLSMYHFLFILPVSLIRNIISRSVCVCVLFSLFRLALECVTFFCAFFSPLHGTKRLWYSVVRAHFACVCVCPFWTIRSNICPNTIYNNVCSIIIYTFTWFCPSIWTCNLRDSFCVCVCVVVSQCLLLLFVIFVCCCKCVTQSEKRLYYFQWPMRYARISAMQNFFCFFLLLSSQSSLVILYEFIACSRAFRCTHWNDSLEMYKNE